MTELEEWKERAEQAEATLAEIIDVYDSYNGKDLLPTPDDYRNLATAINAARWKEKP